MRQFNLGNWVFAICTGVIAALLVEAAKDGFWWTGAAVIAFLGALAAGSVVERIWYLWRGGGVRRLHRNQGSFLKEAIASLPDAQIVRVMGGRGMGLVGRESALGQALLTAATRTDVRILLLRRDSTYLSRRPMELSVERALYKAECVAVDEFLRYLREHSECFVEVRYYNRPRVWRMLLLEDFGFVGYQRKEARGADVRHYEFGARTEGAMFESFVRHFDLVWDESSPHPMAYPAPVDGR